MGTFTRDLDWPEKTPTRLNHRDLHWIDGGPYGTGGHTRVVQNIVQARDPGLSDDDTPDTGTGLICLRNAIWLNRLTGDTFICKDNTTNAAVWVLLGTGGSGGSYTNLSPCPISVGGISAGTTFNNRTMQQMWDALLYPTLYPTLTPPNNTFTLTQAGLHEIAEVLTLNFTANFTQGAISPQYPPTSSPFRSGLPNNYGYTGSGLPANVPSALLSNLQTVAGYTVLSGVQNWTNDVDYDAGVQPYDSSGNPYDSPLPAGSTTPKTVSITGVYPFFGTSASILTLTKQALALMTSAYVQIDMVAEAGADKQKAEFPVAWSAITGVQFYNTVSSAWEWIGGSKANSLLAFTVTATTEVVQGNIVNYNLWTHNGPLIGARQLRFYTT